MTNRYGMYINNYTEETVIMPMADGEYVLFEDYEKIKEENKQLKARISELEGGKQDLGRENIRRETKEVKIMPIIPTKRGRKPKK